MRTPIGIELDDRGEPVEVLGRWRRPREITPIKLKAYQRWLALYDQAQGVPEHRHLEIARQWLKDLFLVLPTRWSDEESGLKTTAYLFLIAQQPTFVFDPEHLSAAMRHFKRFVPTAGEIDEFLTKIRVETESVARRAKECIDAGVSKQEMPAGENPTQDPDWKWENGKETAVAYGPKFWESERRKSDELLEIIRARENAPPPPPDEAPSEDDVDAFLAKHKKYRTALLDDATVEMNTIGLKYARTKEEDDKRRLKPTGPKQLQVKIPGADDLGPNTYTHKPNPTPGIQAAREDAQRAAREEAERVTEAIGKEEPPHAA